MTNFTNALQPLTSVFRFLFKRGYLERRISEEWHSLFNWEGGGVLAGRNLDSLDQSTPLHKAACGWQSFPNSTPFGNIYKSPSLDLLLTHFLRNTWHTLPPTPPSSSFNIDMPFWHPPWFCMNFQKSSPINDNLFLASVRRRRVHSKVQQYLQISGFRFGWWDIKKGDIPTQLQLLFTGASIYYWIIRNVWRHKLFSFFLNVIAI